MKPSGPVQWPTVLLDESERIDGIPLLPDVDAQSPLPADPAERAMLLARINRQLGARERTALCLSGGGIRSASFAVGILQEFGRRELIDGFDYLSTVSGGGYAGGWLSAWRCRARDEQASGIPADDGPMTAAWKQFTTSDTAIGSSTTPPPIEPAPLQYLREFTRYLSPQTGVFSADFWDLVATLLRNLLLNWAVLLPLIAAVMLLPRVQYALIHVIEGPGSRVDWDLASLVAAAASYVAAIAYVGRHLPSYGGRRDGQAQFLRWCLTPLSIGNLALMFYWAMETQFYLGPVGFSLAAAIVHALTWAVLGVYARLQPGAATAPGRTVIGVRTCIAGLCAGGTGGLLYYALFTRLFSGDNLGALYVSTAFPLVMGVLFLQAVLFVGLAGREMTEADLEWGSRAAAWVLIAGAAWLVISATAFGIPALLSWTAHQTRVLASLGGMTAALSGVTSWLLRPAGDRGTSSLLRRVALTTAAPITVILILGGIAAGDATAVAALARAGSPNRFLAPFQQWPICRSPQEAANYSGNSCHPADSGFAETIALGFGFLAIGLFTSRLVPANKFSLHDMYLHRLTRAYLGASRAKRRPDPFTRFDAEDDLPLARLDGLRPYHVLNSTLNLRNDPDKGTRERHASSFTFTARHCGSHLLGYRPSDGYAYNTLRREGVSLAAAVTTSGAAASAQMGEFTTGPLAFLLAFFNARLGVWLGNPGETGEDTWQRRDPKTGVAPILREMLGWTSIANPYVYLSDGGHFDNLGLWEMVLRRCRFIVVIDAGCDPQYQMADLATAVRQVRIDHGVEIVLDPAGLAHLRDDLSRPHVVTGTITYPEDDGRAPGTVVYIKPGLSGDEPVDVGAYQRSHPAFPHESTANQWYSEAQFESYRALGQHSAAAALSSDAGLRLIAVLRAREAPRAIV